MPRAPLVFSVFCKFVIRSVLFPGLHKTIWLPNLTNYVAPGFCPLQCLSAKRQQSFIKATPEIPKTAQQVIAPKRQTATFLFRLYAFYALPFNRFAAR
jgi:hypothetical protein